MDAVIKFQSVRLDETQDTTSKTFVPEEPPEPETSEEEA
jgi:hypothetical protein